MDCTVFLVCPAISIDIWLQIAQDAETCVCFSTIEIVFWWGNCWKNISSGNYFVKFPFICMCCNVCIAHTWILFTNSVFAALNSSNFVICWHFYMWKYQYGVPKAIFFCSVKSHKTFIPAIWFFLGFSSFIALN